MRDLSNYFFHIINEYKMSDDDVLLAVEFRATSFLPSFCYSSFIVRRVYYLF